VKLEDFVEQAVNTKRRISCADCGETLARFDTEDTESFKSATVVANQHECRQQRAANRKAAKVKR